MQAKQKLDALTSLRFFAAAMIVTTHIIGLELFGFRLDESPIAYGQAVSFFFVLSGFILAYVYPKLETWSEFKNFWHARIARVWPALFVSFLLALWLLPLGWDYKTGLANIFMVNAWIPFPKYFFSYNSPSWSISTEFFFYLAFPFLIYRWERTWLIKLLASGTIVILLISISTQLQLPKYVSMEDSIITTTSLLYIHPLSRVFEFIFGMFVASQWRKSVKGTEWSISRATLYELGVILLAILSMYFFLFLKSWVFPNMAMKQWLLKSGSMYIFGLLIYVIAMGRGRISTWLCHPILVLLGEISFSLYLLHQIFLRYYKGNITSFPHLPNLLSLAIFWVIVLLASYLMWALIEMPGRRLILGKRDKIHDTKLMLRSWHSHLNLNRKTITVAILLAGLVTTINFSRGNINLINF